MDWLVSLAGITIAFVFLVAPTVTLGHLLLQPPVVMKTIDQSKEVWSAVVVAVPLGWVIYLLIVGRQLRSLGPNRRLRLRPLSRSNALDLYRRGWRADDVMAAIRPRTVPSSPLAQNDPPTAAVHSGDVPRLTPDAASATRSR